MKTIREEDIAEFIEWVCPYKKCEFLNTEHGVWGISDEYKCSKCKKKCRVIKD